jgi:hypothetical protein
MGGTNDVKLGYFNEAARLQGTQSPIMWQSYPEEPD